MKNIDFFGIILFAVVAVLYLFPLWGGLLD